MLRNLKRAFLASSLLCLPAVMGCADLEPDEQELELASAKQAFSTQEDLSDRLVSHVHSGSKLRICLRSDSLSRDDVWPRHPDVQKAIMKWVEAIAPASSRTLITSNDVLFDCHDEDYSVYVEEGDGRAHASNSRLVIYEDDSFGTLLHEFGHAFWLKDTYVEGVWSCQPGQPNSLMCNQSSIKADDIHGIQEAYCARYPDSCTLRWKASLNWCSHADARLHLGDFNGDGRDDMLCHDAKNGNKWIAQANSSGQFTGTTWFGAMNWCSHADGRLHIGDFNGDGRDDMLCHDAKLGYKWVSLAGAGGTFNGTQWADTTNAWCSHADGRLHIGDFNGDGLDDMLCHDVKLGYKWVALATGNGAFNYNSWSTTFAWCKYENERLHTGDFNGDGRDDLLCHNIKNGDKWISLASARGRFYGTDWNSGLGWCKHATGRLSIGDFNGDGFDDMLCHDIDDGRKWIAFAQGGNDFFLGTSRKWPMEWCKHSTAQFLVGDFNGEGTTDFLCHDVKDGRKWISYQSP
jgi:hypothetical protein